MVALWILAGCARTPGGGDATVDATVDSPDMASESGSDVERVLPCDALVAMDDAGGDDVPPDGAPRAIALAASTFNLCARMSDCTARCTGRTDWGGFLPPEPVTGLSGVAQIARGGRHNCAVLVDGTVRCWGSNDRGQLGNGTVLWEDPDNPPRPVRDLSGAAEIALGGDHSCARIADGSVRCWGANDAGQLGDGTTTMRTTPVRVVGLDGVVQISAGSAQTCARLRDGSVRCWGRTYLPGDDAAMPMWLTPVVVSGLANAAQISAGAHHACAVLTDSTVSCWGNGRLGVLGPTLSGNPNVVPLPGDAVQVAAGWEHTCALLRDGIAYCWGSEEHGALGVCESFTGGPQPIDHRALVRVPDIADFAEIATGVGLTCARRQRGGVYCWGYLALIITPSGGACRPVLIPGFGP